MAADPQVTVTPQTSGPPSWRSVRVLHLRDSPWLDGPGRTIVETGEQFAGTSITYHIGALVHHAGLSHPFVDEARARKLHVHEFVDDQRIPRRVLDGIVQFVDDNGIDLIHCSEFRSNIIGLLVRRRRPRLRLVATVHGWIANDYKGRMFRFIDKSLLRWFDRVLFVSVATRELVPRWWLADTRSHVVHNAVAVSYLQTRHAESREEGARPGRAITLLNVGRLSPEKGQNLLLVAFASVVRQYPQLVLRIAGSGPMELALRDLAAALGIADKVIFLGYVADMRQEYQRADLVVQSSLTEGLPNVVLEVAVLGIPLLATDVGGTAEVVEHSVSAWLIRGGAKSELEAGIRKFVLEPGTYRAMAGVSRKRVLERFSRENRAHRVSQIYQQVAL